MQVLTGEQNGTLALLYLNLLYHKETTSLSKDNVLTMISNETLVKKHFLFTANHQVYIQNTLCSLLYHCTGLANHTHSFSVTVYVLIFTSINFREFSKLHTGAIVFTDFYFRGSGRSNQSIRFFYLAHILCSCTRQECDNVLDGFWGPGDGCRLVTGSETVPGQIFVSIDYCGLGFIREYGKKFVHRESKYAYSTL